MTARALSVIAPVVLGVVAALGFWVLPRLSRLVDGLSISEGTLSLVFVATLLLAWAAEALGGLAEITGAFLSGLFSAGRTRSCFFERR